MTTNAQAQITDSSVIAYLKELGAEIAANGDPSGDLLAEMKAAHARRQRFAEEMIAGKSDRSRKIRQILGAKVYGTIVARHAIRTTLDRMQMQSDEAERLTLFSEGHAALAGWEILP